MSAATITLLDADSGMQFMELKLFNGSAPSSCHHLCAHLKTYCSDICTVEGCDSVLKALADAVIGLPSKPNWFVRWKGPFVSIPSGEEGFVFGGLAHRLMDSLIQDCDVSKLPRSA